MCLRCLLAIDRVFINAAVMSDTSYNKGLGLQSDMCIIAVFCPGSSSVAVLSVDWWKQVENRYTAMLQKQQRDDNIKHLQSTFITIYCI